MSSTPKYNFWVEISEIVCYFFIIHIRPNLRSNFSNHRRLERFQRILRISKLFGSRIGGIKILTMIGVQKCQFLGKKENWTNAYAYCSSKLIVNNECLVYIHSFNPKILKLKLCSLFGLNVFLNIVDRYPLTHRVLAKVLS